MPDKPLAHLKQNFDQFLDDLMQLLKLETVSAQPVHAADMLKGANWVADQFRRLGFLVELSSNGGPPIVFAQKLPNPAWPTVLVYGHYDVQPPEPLELWHSPPFDPEIRDGKIYARGATDDKGQMLTHIKAAEAWIRSTGDVPVNLKFVIEGEEEVGSRQLTDFFRNRQSDLACDVAVISDTSQYAIGIPAITYGLRGIFAAEVTFFGPSHDLHSGIYGGAVANPVTGLARVLGQLHDASGRVAVPGFYDRVRELTVAERAEFGSLPFDEQAFLDDVGSISLFGEAGFSTLERKWARPTCEINGLFGGYTGPGPKTIVPAQATAKITCRLVPDQNSGELTAALQAFFEERLPPGLRMEFRADHGCDPMLTDTESPYMEAASQAIERAFGRRPVLIREGGSIPVVATIKELLGVDTLLLGWGQNTDNLHSPNEHFRVDDYRRGIAASIALMGLLSPDSGLK